MPEVDTNHPIGHSESSEAVGPVTAATQRLVRTAEELDDGTVRRPSLCPGWTRAHVLAHVARNADALTNLLTWASTGTETPMYESAEARAADIEAGASRTLDELLTDVRESAARYGSAIAQVPEEGWEFVVRTGPAATGSPVPARRVVWLRLRELEIHHVDLAAGYSPQDWPAQFVARALRESLRAVGRRDEVPPFTAVVDGRPERVGSGGGPTVRGPAPAVFAWLAGRSTGADLEVEPDGALPQIPPGAWL
ncbi:MAG TPA: maleylpyruvate isomerase family mycothiol-dependent enzyme [Jiangellaceae bacterium]